MSRLKPRGRFVKLTRSEVADAVVRGKILLTNGILHGWRKIHAIKGRTNVITHLVYANGVTERYTNEIIQFVDRRTAEKLLNGEFQDRSRQWFRRGRS